MKNLSHKLMLSWLFSLMVLGLFVGFLPIPTVKASLTNYVAQGNDTSTTDKLSVFYNFSSKLTGENITVIIDFKINATSVTYFDIFIKRDATYFSSKIQWTNGLGYSYWAYGSEYANPARERSNIPFSTKQLTCKMEMNTTSKTTRFWIDSTYLGESPSSWSQDGLTYLYLRGLGNTETGLFFFDNVEIYEDDVEKLNDDFEDGNVNGWYVEDSNDGTLTCVTYSAPSQPTQLSTNAEDITFLESYDGDDEITHPDIIYFPNGWNSYKYWLFGTPYPLSNSDYENPSVWFSNSTSSFSNSSNPLESKPSGGYNSDSDVLWVNGSLYLYWRVTIGSDHWIKGKTSTDGSSWGSYFNVTDTTTNSLLSPSVIYDYKDANYKMWFVDDTGGAVKMIESDTPASFDYSQKQSCSGTSVDYNGNSFVTWHLDIQLLDRTTYIGLFCNYRSATSEYYLWYGTSTDGLSWTMNTTPLLLTNALGGFDEKTIYRSSFLVEDDTMKIFYGGQSYVGGWFLGYTTYSLSGTKTSNIVYDRWTDPSNIYVNFYYPAEYVSATLSSDVLTYNLWAKSGETSVTQVYCGSLGEPSSVTGETSYSYNSGTQILTVSVTHSSAQQITITWPSVHSYLTEAAGVGAQFMSIIFILECVYVVMQEEKFRLKYVLGIILTLIIILVLASVAAGL